jgi:plasmid stabilization system protein ParE
MARVIYSDEALFDFECIIEFFLETTPETAMQTLVNIRSAVGILEAHPLIGRRIEQ